MSSPSLNLRLRSDAVYAQHERQTERAKLLKEAAEEIEGLKLALTPFAVAGCSLSAQHNDLNGALCQLTIEQLKQAAAAVGLTVRRLDGEAV